MIGIPSNDFGGQTPEAGAKVKDFCKINYGVSFTLTEKTKILNAEKNSFANWLVSSSQDNAKVKWNFEKFLVNKDGKIVKRYPANVTPNDSKLATDIEKLLSI